MSLTLTAYDFCRSLSTSRLSPSIITFLVVSQSTLSSGQGRRVPVDGVRASCRARRLPCQLRPYFSSRSSTTPPSSCLSTSKSILPSTTVSGKRAFSCSIFSATISAEVVSVSRAVNFFMAVFTERVSPEQPLGPSPGV